MESIQRILKPETQALKRNVWRRLLRLRFLLFQRHRHNHMVLERAAGYPILVLPQVFNPVLFRTGEFLAQALDARRIPPGSTVLDMGTGSGIGAIAAARWAGRVVAVDINPEAVRCARINILLNRVEHRVEVREGDLFAPVSGERFDVVLFNPPYYAGQPADALDRAFRSTDVAERFAGSLADHLSPQGRAFVLLSTDGQLDRFLKAFEAAGLAVEPVTERAFVNEVLIIYEVRRSRVQQTEQSP